MRQRHPEQLERFDPFKPHPDHRSKAHRQRSQEHRDVHDRAHAFDRQFASRALAVPGDGSQRLADDPACEGGSADTVRMARVNIRCPMTFTTRRGMPGSTISQPAQGGAAAELRRIAKIGELDAYLADLEAGAAVVTRDPRDLRALARHTLNDVAVGGP